MKKISSFEEYRSTYRKSVESPETFWSEIADSFTWKERWSEVLQWNFEEPEVKWFLNAKVNITENCLDRHLAASSDETAIIWEPNDPNEEARRISYSELHLEVCKAANALKELGVQKGDRVCLYLPMIPETAIAMLACARIGAIHSVVFAGFSAASLADRINDAGCSFVITADGFHRGNKHVQLKAIVDEALEQTATVRKTLVVKRTPQESTLNPEKEAWWHDVVDRQQPYCEAEAMDSEDMLFILYTSGSTGKPKGVVHTIGGYMVFVAYSFLNVFQYNKGDVYWCTADVGWVTGHSYLLYGPLLNGATTLMFEGVPTWPDASRFWQVAEKHRVNIFYTAPTAIRSLQAAGDHFTEGFNLSPMRVLGSVGEPINEEAWHWYQQKIGKGRCPVVDTWWQTETGGILISPLAGITPEIPGFATLPLPGVQPVLLDASGNELQGSAEGNLCIRFPWPSIIRTTFGDHERCRNAYFATYPGYYFTGDGCRRDDNGYYRITGRVDDVMNVSGHRIGTAEVENAINTHPDVVESAVVSYPHPLKGEGIYAYVITTRSTTADALKPELDKVITGVIGAIAKTDIVQIVPALPKTRSGKIMRRILRKIAEGKTSELGDTSTLLDPGVVREIAEGRTPSQ